MGEQLGIDPIRKLQNELDRWKKALYSVTPGIGSECIDDPEFCAKRIEDTRRSQHEMIIKLAMKVKQQDA